MKWGDHVFLNDGTGSMIIVLDLENLQHIPTVPLKLVTNNTSSGAG